MQAKLFWPPTKHKLFYANLAVYGVTIVLLAVFYHELIWAQKALRIYLFSEGVPNPAEKILIGQAMQGVKKGEDVKHTQQLFEQVVQIDPYSEAQLLLGFCYYKQGDYDKMLDCYKQYRAINPYDIDVYKYMIEALEKKQDRKAIAKLLSEGIGAFRRRVELYKPYYDPNVPDVFNQKAFKVYKDSQEALKLLEERQKQLKL